MKFLIRPGSDPFARADAMLLSAMGLPGGGIVRVGRTHVLIRPGEVTESNALMLGDRTMTNAGVKSGETVEAKRVLLPQAQRVVLAGDELPLEPRHVARALQGIPVTVGDLVSIDPSYGTADAGQPIEVSVVGVIPAAAGTVGSGTTVGSEGDIPPSSPISHPEGRPTGEPPTTADALLTGLETELETLAGWLALLTSPGNLPSTWGLPAVAGIVLEGPSGVGKSELVSAAAEAAGATVNEISLELVFKPEKLLDLVEKGVKGATGPTVIFLDRLDAVAGDEGMFRNQMGAILRWFLDAVAEKPGLACVLGVSSLEALDDGVATSPLLPRKLSIPPPDLQRRRLLFEAALGKVPSDDINFDVLAAKSAGFSGADVIAAIVHASAMVVRGGGRATTDILLAAIEGTTPSLGAVSLGEMPSYGFERVANLDDVKQRLTEAVIWPIQNPERFESMGIEPPRGILLHGPPGTGKTYVTRALAHEAGAAFFSVKGAELLDKFVGESERGVRELFGRARSVAPSIIFFDEFDALAPVRGNSNNSVTDSVVAALLTEIDGVSDRGDVVVIGATNRKDLIDPALLRGGRLETHILLGLPPKASRMALLEITDVPFAGDVDLDRLAEVTEGLSFADLTSLLREAALNVLRTGREELEVTWSDLEQALGRFNTEVV
ncbi:MAG: AAA family ATPase [Acidimicrobiia bacterium]|nr:AAA family ATPase [Acidimicrobiia bacterium]NNF10330.1 AAA family ATPase [Acidimicrobiia bacterium]NNL70856.1 AAA family ATPase [Acidimicrobiia bacterium]